MAKRRAVVDYDKCVPDECDPNEGLCVAVEACSRNVMVQEEKYESPVMMHWDMCQGCSDCREACPLNAITIVEA